MLTSLSLKNYRAFGKNGVSISFEHQFIAFIGLNNSGKSSLLRSIYELRPIFNFIASANLGDGSYQQLFAGNGGTKIDLKLLVGERVFPSDDNVSEPEIVLNFLNKDPRMLSIIELKIIILRDSRVRVVCRMNDGSNSEGFVIGRLMNARGHTVIEGMNSSGNTVELDLEGIKEDLKWLASAMYIGPFRNVINSGGADYYDISTGQDFLSQFDLFKNGPVAEENESVIQMSDEIARIFGMKRLAIDLASDKRSLVFVVNGKSFRGSELGGGITQFLIVAANVLVRRPNLLLIDEPELNLHASLQVQFLTLLATYTKDSVIFSTHSLGLARLVADRVYVVQRDSNGRSTIQDYREMANVSAALTDLGYGGLNDSGYKAVLLVEGVSEVRVFKEFLSKLDVKSEVVFISLGGDNLATGTRSLEIAELSRLADKIFAIVDSERTDAGKPAKSNRIGFAEVCKKQGIACLVLERRATENYLDQDTARRVLNVPNAQAFGPFEKSPPEWSWGKEKNWRIAQEMDLAGLEGTDLGDFLQKLAKAALSN